MISSSHQTTYIHTHTLCSYKISALTSEQQVNFYCLYRNIKKPVFFFPATVVIYHNQPPTMLVALHWACSRVSTSFLHREAPDWAQHSRYSLTSAKQKGRITSPDLPAIHLLTQPRMRLPFLAATTHSLQGLLLTHIQLVVHHDLQSCFLDCWPTTQPIPHQFGDHATGAKALP